MNESKIVYHYCSVDTFIKIIKNKEIWLTDITKSNDSKELRLTYEMIENLLLKRSEPNKETVDEWLNNYVPTSSFKEFMDFFQKNNQLVHVCCFSEDSDSLSQWSMYADNATGIAIGFDKAVFSALAMQDKNLDFKQVNYSLSSLSDITAQKIDELIASYHKRPDNDNSWLYEFINYIISNITSEACFYKNQSFEQEHEYRLVYNSKPFFYNHSTHFNTGLTFSQEFDPSSKVISSDVTIGKIDYYISKGKIVSYRPLQIGNLKNVIREIVLGPKSKATVNDIEMVLETSSVDLPVGKIKISNSTYQ